MKQVVKSTVKHYKMDAKKEGGGDQSDSTVVGCLPCTWPIQDGPGIPSTPQPARFLSAKPDVT